MSSYTALALVVGAAVALICFVVAILAWLDVRGSRSLPEVNVDAEEELEHLRRRERLHVVPHEPDPPYDWAREEKRL